MAENNLIVGGYRFGSDKDARLAEQEMNKAAYLEQKLEGKSPQNILIVYDKLLDEKVFQTPAGWEYLKYLQERLKESGMQEDKIRPVPMYVVFGHDEVDKQENGGIAREYVKPSVRRQNRQKNTMRLSVVMNVILAVMVIAMFIITLTGENPNIINYKSALNNQYAKWEDELTEREKAVREKELELSIEP